MSGVLLAYCEAALGRGELRAAAVLGEKALSLLRRGPPSPQATKKAALLLARVLLAAGEPLRGEREMRDER